MDEYSVNLNDLISNAGLLIYFTYGLYILNFFSNHTNTHTVCLPTPQFNHRCNKMPWQITGISIMSYGEKMKKKMISIKDFKERIWLHDPKVIPLQSTKSPNHESPLS